ncbi:phage antirepressor [Metapseudomonas otitidis]|uniref:BRO-N domain-containing protein n=1 Tax=Metapseudomonas otitidis TaxID=319939 RepID=UPI00253F665B|nr:phage antirepressor [Pseudomonas otitidis]WIF69586.1 phage antirepressor [Pseudomonas otitidis]
MHDAFTPITFQRHCHQLRAVMIDNRPWFVALDFALMIAATRPYRLTKRLYPHQFRFAILRYSTGRCEEVELVSDAGLYRALYRFGHPEHCALSQWLSDEVIPTLHDYHRDPQASPRRILMTWANQRIAALHWQSETWIARQDLPRFMAAHDDPLLGDGPSWRRFF